MTRMRQKGVLCNQCGKAIRVVANMDAQIVEAVELPQGCTDAETCQADAIAGIFEREFEQGSKNYLTK